MQDLIIDIGANLGDFSLEIAARNPDIHVLAIEPVPQLCRRITQLAEARDVRNLGVCQVAIDASPRTAVLHLAEHAECGVSSLLDFDREHLEHDEYWKQRDDLRFTGSIEVSVTRLDLLPQVAAGSRIRFIKIDAQGVDIPALESLGSSLSLVDAGMLEVPTTRASTLYAGDAYDLHSAMTRLTTLGFYTYAIKPNDQAANEMNLFFCRLGLDSKAIEQSLQLRGLEMYDGKHFWHSPSNRLISDNEMTEARRILERLSDVEAALTREYEETRRLTNTIAGLDAALTRECTETRRLNDALARLEEGLARECAETKRLNAAMNRLSSPRPC